MGPKGGKRQKGDLNRSIGITVFFFPVWRSETLLDMVNTDTEKLDEESGLDLDSVCFGFAPMLKETLCCRGE